MSYSTERKKKSHLQGHRKRRRIFEVKPEETESVKLSWTEYKTIRQYQTMGDLLDGIRVYGTRECRKVMASEDKKQTKNGHMWLTKD
ncbi:MAG: hypothetical protein KAT46_07225 [Deltaproteobacteria bacterium]|nr:hypothetical protein [Deltaproteobacteria bacterium]